MSSADEGQTWEAELVKEYGKDVREPYLLELNGTLHLYFVYEGFNAEQYQTNTLWRTTYLGERGKWSGDQAWGQQGETTWQFGVENGTAYVSSYAGNQQDLTAHGNVSIMFNKSDDGVNWEPVDAHNPSVYNGGGTAAAWGYDLQGNLYSLIENAIGDESGWGSRLAVAHHD